MSQAVADSRPQATAPSYGDASEDPVAALRRLDLFRELTDQERQRIVDASEVVKLPQDRIVPRGGEGGEARAFYFLLKGQVAFAEFDRGTAPKGPVNPKKRVQPIMQIAHKNVALFEESDLFANDHVAEARGEDGQKREMALYTCLPVVLLKIPRDELDQILQAVPKLKAAIDQRAEATYYRQTFLKLETRGDILDFYLKQGFEYAQAIKVIQTDKCIDCDNCIKACEDRHGVSRIERFGPKLGLIQFTQNCRTCHDARCLEPCNFDAIGFDPKANEVVVYDNCVGCTLCSKACPHEAIRMVDIIEPEPKEIDLVQLAAEKQGAKPGTVVAAGEEKKAKKKKVKRIANKCDHCLGYNDLACISACPTGAIIQIDPRALFRRDGGLVERAEAYFDPRPFEQGYSQVARSQGVTVMLTLFTTVGIGVLACVWEYFARKLAPDLSLWRLMVSLSLGEAAGRRMMLTYTAASGMGRWMGYLGAGMMIVSALYTLRINLPGLRRVGNSKTWFDFHVVFGIAGPVLSLLHTDLHVFQLYWVTLLWWAVFLVVVSGLIGRYLYTAVPRLEASADRQKKQLDDGIRAAADQWGNMTMSANVLQQFLKAQEKTSALEANEAAMGPFRFVGWLLASELRQLRASAAVRFRLLGSMKNARLRKAAIRLMARRGQVERRAKILGFAKALLAQWRAFHIGLSIVMFVLLIAHVAISIWAVGL
ncbi:MAG: 4Fe-4S dicluster domain-containing protein [Deltaproteobacteria bacterium]|nr:4Fe-4S dicluster domain-containing protein [Deltaproteobacteria bacterium]